MFSIVITEIFCYKRANSEVQSEARELSQVPAWVYSIMNRRSTHVFLAVLFGVIAGILGVAMAKAYPADADEPVPHKVRCQQVMVDLHNGAGLHRGFTLGDETEIVTNIPSSAFELLKSYQRSRGDHAVFSFYGRRTFLVSLRSAMSQLQYSWCMSDRKREEVRRISRSSEAIKLARRFAWLACPLDTEEEEWQFQPGDISVNLCFKHRFRHLGAGEVVVGVTAVTEDGKLVPRVVSYEILESPLIE